MIKKFLLFVFTLLTGLAVYLFFYLGSYKPVEITQEKLGPLYLLYKAHVGAYHEIGPTIQEVEKWAKGQNIPCLRTFGEYLDNPESMDQDRLRSRGGCLLVEPLALVPPQFQYEARPERIYVVGRFTGSPAIGPFKVYPMIKKYLDEHRLSAKESVIEIYQIDGMEVRTEYLFDTAVPPAK